MTISFLRFTLLALLVSTYAIGQEVATQTQVTTEPTVVPADPTLATTTTTEP